MRIEGCGHDRVTHREGGVCAIVMHDGRGKHGNSAVAMLRVGPNEQLNAELSTVFERAC